MADNDTRVVDRHLRFAWIEYQEHGDGAAFCSAFQSAKLGWDNLFNDLPLVKNPEDLTLANHLLPNGKFFQLLPLSLGSANLPGDRIDKVDPWFDISILSNPADAKEAGLILRPNCQLNAIRVRNGLPPLSPDDLREQINLLDEVHADVFGRWVLNPGVHRISATRGHLTSESGDATDFADMVVMSGHGGGGAVFGFQNGAGAQIDLAEVLEKNVGRPSSGRLRYLVIPACRNLEEKFAKVWLSILQKDKPVHGVLGYSGSYPGDPAGARLMKNFAKFLVENNRSIPIIDAWKRANAGAPWGAVMLKSALKDTLGQWITPSGLPDLTGSVDTIHLDPSHPNGIPVVAFDEFSVIFHMANGTSIVRGNNNMAAAENKTGGLIVGERGHLLIRANKKNSFSSGQHFRFILIYWRPEKLRVEVSRVLSFDAKSPRLTISANAIKGVYRGNAYTADEIDYVFQPGETKEAKLTYTVGANAHQHTGLEKSSTSTMGRFHIGIFAPGQGQRPQDLIELIETGAFLRVP